MQNVLVLGAAAFLQFTAYLTIQNFETSVFGDAGNKILFTCYFVHIFGSFISPFFTQRLGPRWALALSNLTYVAIVAGNLQSRIWLLALAFAAGGVGGGVWWTAHGEFLMGPACTGPGISFDRASGVFFGLYQFSGVAGNLAAAAILDLGLGFHVLVGLMTVLCALGGLMFFLLKEAPGPKAPRAAGGAHNEGLAALHWMRDPRAPWMWAIMFYWGLSQSYFFGQLPKMVPGMALTATVMACWSLANVVGSFFVGRFAGVWGRGPLLLATTALQTAGLLQSVAFSLVYEFLFSFPGSLQPHARWLTPHPPDRGLTPAYMGLIKPLCMRLRCGSPAALRPQGHKTQISFFIRSNQQETLQH